MEQPQPRKRSLPAQFSIFLSMLAVYTVAIHAPFLGVVEGDIQWYRLTHMLLLYGCSVCVFFLAWLMVGRPMWLASFAAVLFMANPAKIEVFLDAAGLKVLLPGLFALLAIAALAGWLARGGWCWAVTALLALSASLWIHIEDAGAVLAPLMILLLCDSGAQVSWKLRSALAVVLFAALTTWAAFSPLPALDLSLTALALVMYPIGLLPSSVAILDRFPWIGALFAMLALGVLLAVYRQSRHRALLTGVFGAAGSWLLTRDQAVDLTSMEGGGQLLIPMALLSVSLAALCQSIARHPKWIRPMVLITAIWCLVFFALYLRAGWCWPASVNAVHQLSGGAAEAAASPPFPGA